MPPMPQRSSSIAGIITKQRHSRWEKLLLGLDITKVLRSLTWIK